MSPEEIAEIFARYGKEIRKLERDRGREILAVNEKYNNLIKEVQERSQAEFRSKL